VIQALRAIFTDDGGAALPEYALVLALLAIVSIVAMAAVGTQANATLTNTYNGFQNLQENPPL